MKVFCYGTLKEGHGNNYLLKRQGAVKVCDAIVEGFKLYDSNFPVASHDPESSVTGEVWDIGDTHDKYEVILATLDRLEGYPRMYMRQEVTAFDTEGNTYEAHMYYGNPRNWNFSEYKECPSQEVTFNDRSHLMKTTKLYTWDR